MSEERNPTVPFGTFYHPPIQLADVMREKNCLSSTTFAVMNGLFSLVDFNRTERIGNHDVFEGWTCVVSYGGLGERCGLSGRRTQDALKKLESVGLIIREKVGKCNRYRITIYDQALNHLKANPGTPMKQMSQPVGSDKHKKNVKKIQDGASRMVDDETSNIEPITDGASESLRTERPSHYGRSVPHPRVLQEEYQETPVSDYPGPNEESEKRGVDHRDNEEQEKASLRRKEGIDVVPTPEIGKAKEVDKLVEAIMGGKQSNTTPPEDGIEPFIDSFNDAFNLESVAVLSQGYVEPALELQKGISSKLSAAGLALSVDRFLEKYLAPCVHESLADGTLDELPRAFGFFLRKT